MGRKHDKKHTDRIKYAGEPGNAEREDSAPAPEKEDEKQNPPRTTSHGWFTAPKFGGATSGGGEIEPGPEKD